MSPISARPSHSAGWKSRSSLARLLAVAEEDTSTRPEVVMVGEFNKASSGEAADETRFESLAGLWSDMLVSFVSSSMFMGTSAVVCSSSGSPFRRFA